MIVDDNPSPRSDFAEDPSMWPVVSPSEIAIAEWILDMPRAEWDPHRLPAAPDAVCDPADPLPPGQAHEFTLVHYDGGPHGWAGCLCITP